MNTRLAQARVRALIATDAAALHVAPPYVRFVTTSGGACYEALFNRIEIDPGTLALPEPLLSVVIAHEVGHATQRRTMLVEFAWSALIMTALISIPCFLFATSSDEEFWRVSTPGMGFVLAFFAFRKIWRVRAVKRAAAFELDADAKAASIHGPDSALQALEAMAARGHIDDSRLEAMRARLAAA
jgi:Zn-dependent protease with chaperone function